MDVFEAYWSYFHGWRGKHYFQVEKPTIIKAPKNFFKKIIEWLGSVSWLLKALYSSFAALVDICAPIIYLWCLRVIVSPSNCLDKPLQFFWQGILEVVFPSFLRLREGLAQDPPASFLAKTRLEFIALQFLI